MAKRSEGFFKGYDDIELFYQTWASDNPAGTLVITHGIGEHSESYIRLADGLKHTPWEVYAWDLRGHGRSEGKRGVVKSFSEYYRDLHCFLELVKEKNADRPTVLLGHSLGGLINIRGIQELENLTLKAAV